MQIHNLTDNCLFQGNQGPISIRCPMCKQIGSFEGLGSGHSDLLYQSKLQIGAGTKIEGVYILGHRFCPNQKCKTHVFFIAKHDKERTVIECHPALRIDFDSTSIPANISRTFEEALTCHSHGCHTAAAIMVRKTMEELCEDQQATGGNLRDKIQNLGTKVTLPPALIAGIDNIRLLGNDAAHLELKHFDNIGTAELDAAITVTKEVLKGVYQYADLIKQLESLKKTP